MYFLLSRILPNIFLCFLYRLATTGIDELTFRVSASLHFYFYLPVLLIFIPLIMCIIGMLYHILAHTFKSPHVSMFHVFQNRTHSILHVVLILAAIKSQLPSKSSLFRNSALRTGNHQYFTSRHRTSSTKNIMRESQ